MGKKREWWALSKWERQLRPGWRVMWRFPDCGRVVLEGALWDALWVQWADCGVAKLVIRCGDEIVRAVPAVWPGLCVVSCSVLEERAMSFLRKAAAAQGVKRAQVAAQAVDWVADHPALWEYMTADTWEDGASRETAMLMFFAEDGRFKGCVQDRAQGRSLWVTSDSIDGCIALLETHLQQDTGDWRQSKAGTGRPGKKNSR